MLTGVQLYIITIVGKHDVYTSSYYNKIETWKIYGYVQTGPRSIM